MECSHVEAVWIGLRTNRKKPLLVCTIYQPPDSRCQFFDSLSSVLENAIKECTEILLMGDFKINFLSDCSISRLMQCLSDGSNLTQTISRVMQLE